jgi:hypothetical protein
VYITQWLTGRVLYQLCRLQADARAACEEALQDALAAAKGREAALQEAASEGLLRTERLRAELASATQQCQVLCASTTSFVQERLQLLQQLAGVEASLGVRGMLHAHALCRAVAL